MSTRIEWATISAETLYSDEPGFFEDQNGEESDGPTLGVFTGSDGWVIEAPTPEALAEWLEEWAQVIRRKSALREGVIPGEVVSEHQIGRES